MACNSDSLQSGKVIINNTWEIVTGLDFCEMFLIRDPTQDKIPNPDFDDTLPITDTNQPEVFPPLDLNGYTGKMDIRAGNTRDSQLIHTIETGGGGMTVNDPALGWVKLFIDGTVTGNETGDPDNPGIGDFAGKCAFYDLILDPNQVGMPAKRIFKGSITITEATTNV